MNKGAILTGIERSHKTMILEIVANTRQIKCDWDIVLLQ